MKDECPKCHANLQGEPIPKEYRGYYHPETTHYSRKIGIYDQEKDMTVAWKCPDCGHEWRRE